LLNSNICATCSDNIANFGLLTAEIISGVWGTPANFNGFSLLGSVTARHSSSAASAKLCGVEQRQGGHHVGHWPAF